MAGYLVLARKYRSLTFDEVVGQEPIARTLKNAIKSGRIAHAYLFSGTRGVGKTTMARILAKAMNCLSSEAPTTTPCNECDACVSIGRGDDIDVIEIDGASNRGIEQIRELRSNVIFSPGRCRFKVYYIDEVHMLTKEAFNALLKTLEEPPGHVKFIFSTTEPQKVPPTVLSRCQRFDFRNIPTGLIAEHLVKICESEKVKVDGDAMFRIARAAAGSMRDALGLLDQLLAAGSGQVTDEQVVQMLGTPADERTLSIARAIADGDTAAALGELDAVLADGVTLGNAVGALGDIFRNMMLSETCGSDSELIELPEAARRVVAELAGRFSIPALVQAVGICQRAARNVRISSVARGLVEAALVRLAEADKFVDAASLIERIEALEAGGGTGRTGGEKKKPLLIPHTKDGPPVSDGSQASSPAVLWEQAWLRSNWQVVIDNLAARRQMQVAGALRPAEVLGFEDGALKLGYDSHHEVLRQRCTGPLAEVVNAALRKLADREIQCQFVSTAPDEKTHRQRNAFGGLSTAEKNEINKDTEVKAVIGLFGGEVVDVRKQVPPAASDSAEAEQNN